MDSTQNFTLIKLDLIDESLFDLVDDSSIITKPNEVRKREHETDILSLNKKQRGEMIETIVLKVDKIEITSASLNRLIKKDRLCDSVKSYLIY